MLPPNSARVARSSACMAWSGGKAVGAGPATPYWRLGRRRSAVRLAAALGSHAKGSRPDATPDPFARTRRPAAPGDHGGESGASRAITAGDVRVPPLEHTAADPRGLCPALEGGTGETARTVGQLAPVPDMPDRCRARGLPWRRPLRPGRNTSGHLHALRPSCWPRLQRAHGRRPPLHLVL